MGVEADSIRKRAQTWANGGRRANVNGVRAAREPRKPKKRLSNLTEQRVLKEGIRRLNSLLVREGIDLLELPKRSDGTPRLLRPTFFERILSNQVQLQTAMPNDVAASQSDLKLLRLEQLLAIRVSALDFATASQSHDAHNNFLNTLDKHLFEHVARKHIRDSVDLPSAPDPLYRLGVQMCLVLGATGILQDGLSVSPGNSPHKSEPLELTPEADANDASSSPPASPSSATAAPLPARWAIALQANQWPGDPVAAIFDTAFLDLVLIHREVASASGGESIAVVCDRTTGTGKDRMIHWEIAAVDPKTEDFFEEFDRSQRNSLGGREKAKTMGQELDLLLARRKAASDAVEPNSDTVIDTKASVRRSIVFDLAEEPEEPSAKVEGESDDRPAEHPVQEVAASDSTAADTVHDNGTSPRLSTKRSNSPAMPPLPSKGSRPRPSVTSAPSTNQPGRMRAATAPASIDLLDTSADRLLAGELLFSAAQLGAYSLAGHGPARPTDLPARRVTVAVPAILPIGSRQSGPMPMPPKTSVPRQSIRHRRSGIAPLPPPCADEFCVAQQSG